MFDYSEMQGVASGILKEFRQGVVKLVQITPGTGPTANPGPPTENIQTIEGAVVRGVSSKFVMRKLAVDTDLQATIDASFNPAMRDFMEVDGKRYKIKHIENKPAAGTPVVRIVVFGN